MIVRDSSRTRRSGMVVAIILALLQLSVVPYLGIAGGRANLALVLTAFLALGGDAGRATIAGFFAGLFYDLAGTGPIGLMALLLTILGFLMSSAERPGVADDPVSSLVLFVPASLAVGLVYGFILLATGQASSLFDTVVLRALPGSLLDCLWFAAISLIAARLQGPRGTMGASRKGGHYSMRGL